MPVDDPGKVVSGGLARLLLGDDRRQRLRLARSFIAAFMYGVGWWVGEYALEHWPVSVQGVRLYQAISLLASVFSSW